MSGQLIQERLEELQPYVQSIRYFEGMPVIEVQFKEKWTIPNNSELITREVVDESAHTYMFFPQKVGIGIDQLLDYAENIIEINREREMKNELFRVKIRELQQFFNDNSLAELQGMSFKLGKPTPSKEDFNPDEINFDDEISVPTPEPVAEAAPAQVATPVVEQAPAPAPQQKVVNNTKVELPPKKGSKPQVEGDLIPAEAKEGPCDCGPEEACIKCMDEKSL